MEKQRKAEERLAQRQQKQAEKAQGQQQRAATREAYRTATGKRCMQQLTAVVEG